MTFFNFLLIVTITVYVPSILFAIIEKLEKKKTLLSMYESGAMASSASIPEQVEEMEIEELNEYERVLEWDIVKDGERTSNVFVLDITPNN